MSLRHYSKFRPDYNGSIKLYYYSTIKSSASALLPSPLFQKLRFPDQLFLIFAHILEPFHIAQAFHRKHLIFPVIHTEIEIERKPTNGTVTRTIIHAKVRTGFRFSRITLKTTLATVRIYRAIKTYMIICNQDIKKYKKWKSFQFSIFK